MLAAAGLEGPVGQRFDAEMAENMGVRLQTRSTIVTALTGATLNLTMKNCGFHGPFALHKALQLAPI